MMRLFKVAGICIFLMVPYFLSGCAGSSNKAYKLRATLLRVNYKADGYIQKVGIVFGGAPGTAVGRHIGDLYLNKLMTTIRQGSRRVRLISEQDSDFPEFLQELNKSSDPRDIFKIAELGRAQGYQGFIRAAVLEIQPRTKKTGVLWFRKTRYFITFGLSLDLYDPFTGAKLLSRVREETIKVGIDEYEAVRNQDFEDLEELSDAVVDAAEDMGDEVAKIFRSEPWKVSVKAIQNGRIFLAGGAQAGLKVGDRLAVFQARRTIEGPDGEKFIVPGYQVGEIRIAALDEQMAEAAADAKADIQEGDIAIPIH